MDPSRRDFLGGTFGCAALPGAVAGLLDGQIRRGRLRAETPRAGGSVPWDDVRARFSFAEERVPMNAANLCPSSIEVAARVEELSRDIDRDCSFQNRAKFRGMAEDARARIAKLLGASADEIAIVRNTSEANNTICAGLDLGPGDEVLLWDQNHPTNNVAWEVRAQRTGVRTRKASTPTSPSDAGELAAPFLEALGASTRVLALTHISNVTGIRLPVREIALEARRRGVFVHVDGAQSWGAADVNLREMGCDSYSASAHKWLMGPKEAGILYVRAERVSELWPHSVAPSWGADIEPDPMGARKFESLGQRDDACLGALGTAVALHEEIGPARIEARIQELAKRLKEGMRALGLELVTPMRKELSLGVCIARAGPNRSVVLDRLYREFGIAGAETGGVRLCPHVYNTEEHVERALRALGAMRDEIRGGAG